MLEVEDEFGTKYSVLLSKTYESEKELVPEKKGKVRVTGFKQFVAIVDTPKGSFSCSYRRKSKSPISAQNRSPFFDQFIFGHVDYTFSSK